MRPHILVCLLAAACGVGSVEESAQDLDETQPLTPAEVQVLEDKCAEDFDREFDKLINTFEARLNSGRIQPGPRNVAVLEGDPQTTPGACSKKVADLYREALECARSRITGCLTIHNEALAKLLGPRLGNYGPPAKPLLVACKMPSSCMKLEYDGLTDILSSEVARGRSGRQLIYPGALLLGSKNQRCDLVMHEAMHWAGDYGSGTDAAAMAKGHDKTDHVYACSEFCSGAACDRGSALQPCLRCAGTAEEKLLCGKREKATPGCVAPLFVYGACAMNPPNASLNPCPNCRTLEWQTCDGIPDPVRVKHECCERCARADYIIGECSVGDMNPYDDCKPMSPGWCTILGGR